MFPINRLNMIKHTFDPPPFSHGVSNSALASYLACNSEGESDGTVVNNNGSVVMILAYLEILILISITSTLIIK